MKNSQDIINRILTMITKILTMVTTLCFFSILICVFLEVIFRYLLKISVPWTEEAARYLLVWMVFTGAIVAFKREENIKLTIILDKIPERTRMYFLIFIYLVIGLFNIILFKGSISMAKLDWHVPSTTMPGVVVGYLYLSCVFSCFLISILVFIKLINIILYSTYNQVESEEL